MKDKKTELARSLAISASSETIIRNYLDRSTILFSLVITKNEVQEKKDEIQKAYNNATNDIMEYIIESIKDDFSLKELEKLNLIMEDPLFIKFNDFWKDNSKATEFLYSVADKRAAELVRELNEMFPAEYPSSKETLPPKDKSQLN
ncbi:MAG TPA: hypothetical protein VMX17_01080 [Candidatus Glassbacteria bacterium]|nr:hypothetical protein [Candidatus Glassbacteria bacterium]